MATKTKTKKKPIIKEPEQQEDYPMVPPEVHFLADRYVVKLPVSDPHFASPWELRVHVAKVLERHLGDHVEMTGMKVRKPHLIAKSVSKMRGQEPYARMYVTVKF